MNGLSPGDVRINVDDFDAATQRLLYGWSRYWESFVFLEEGEARARFVEVQAMYGCGTYGEARELESRLVYSEFPISVVDNYDDLDEYPDQEEFDVGEESMAIEHAWPCLSTGLAASFLEPDQGLYDQFIEVVGVEGNMTEGDEGYDVIPLAHEAQLLAFFEAHGWRSIRDDQVAERIGPL
jgi:hypothetical protein